MTHIPQARVVIIVPYYHWGRLVERAYLGKLIEMYGEDNVRSLNTHFDVVTPRDTHRLRGLSRCLVLLHNEWSLSADPMHRRNVYYQLQHWRHYHPVDVEIQEIGEDYYR